MEVSERVDFCRLLRYDYQVCILYVNRKKQGILFSFSSARLSACDVENAFNYIDADHNGKINLVELRTSCEEVIKEKSPGSIPDVKVNEVFKKVDINNDGYIDIEEFRNTLKSD